jgi:serine/threonine protein kinase/Tol biopolymer transport system component
MSLTLGSVINHYKISSLLGVGGMGEVYKAQDVNLERPVALKILPAHLVADSDRVRRFVQEAKSASALNHPHIITIYEIGQASPSQILDVPPAPDNENNAAASAIHYMAMEFVDGVTLHYRIHKEKTDLKKLLDYLAQVAEGLAKAHSAGIVHRDLKPENIMITNDGYAKILDFGLAKLVEAGDSRTVKATGADLEEAATAMMNQTQPGMVMGTVGYMSPEQVQGKEVDQRSDTFSFGCILYEATTGHKPFKGDSLIDSLHKIIYSQPQPIRELNPSAPAELQRIIRKCMAKDPAERFQSIKDVALDLRDLVREYDSQVPVSGLFNPGVSFPPSGASPSASSGAQANPLPTAAQPQYQMTGQHDIPYTSSHVSLASGSVGGVVTGAVPAVRGKRWLLIGAGVLGLAILAFAIFQFAFRVRNSRGNKAAFFQTTKTTKLTNTGKSAGAVISPDGRLVAHLSNDAGKQTLMVRQTATAGNVTVVPPDEEIFTGIAFSRDSNFLYYSKHKPADSISTLYKIPALGGAPPTKVIEDVDCPVSFSPDGKRFAFIRNRPLKGESSLMVANEDGSNEQQIALHGRGDFFTLVAWSPDGRTLACTTRRTEGGIRIELLAVKLSDSSEKVIGTQKWAVISGMGWLANSSGLLLSGMERGIANNKFQLWQIAYPEGQARKLTDGLTNYAGLSLTADSRSLVTLQANVTSQLWLLPLNDASKAKQISTGSVAYDHLKWTSDGKIVCVSDESGAADLWIMDADGRNKKQLTSNSALNVYPFVSSDDRSIIFDSNRGSNPAVFNIWRLDREGGNQRQLTQGQGEYFPVLSPDGKWILYTAINDAGKPTIWKAPAEGGEGVEITKNLSFFAKISPDGKSFVCRYNDEKPGGSFYKLAVLPIDGGAPVKIFDLQIELFEWTADGKGILYIDNKSGVSNLWLQPMDGSAAKQVSQFQTDQIFSFALSRDGKQIIFSRGNETIDGVLIKDAAEANP